MPLYVYEALDRTGKKISAEIEAASGQEASAKIRKLGYFPKRIQELTPSDEPAKAGIAAEAAVAARPRAVRKKKQMIITIGGVSRKQLTQFTQQLSILQDAGLPLLRSLRILMNQQKSGLFKNILEQVVEDVEAGNPFSEALSKQPKAFDRLYVNMIRAGEAGGVLDVILMRLATFMEKAQALKRKVIGALTYPAMVIVVAVLIITVIMSTVVPQFAKIFAEMGKGALPAPTLLLLAISDTIRSFWFLLPLIPVVFFIIIKMAGANPRGRFYVDKFKLRTPLVGIIVHKASVSRFCRTLGTLLASGVPILEALVIVRNTVGNEVMAVAVEKVRGSIREGEGIAKPLGDSGVFDDMVISMIEVGEETGELDKMLMKVADTYEADVDVLVGSLTSILEPLIIVTLGGAVGFIVISLFMPLLSLMKEMGGA